VGHAALVTDYTGACTPSELNEASNFVITEMPGPLQGVKTNTLDKITDNDPWGCYTTPGLSYSDRLKILKSAKAALDDGGITYTGTNILLPANWDDTIDSITDLRCDGLVEMCYEINGFDVWGKIVGGGTPRYDTKNNTYQTEHNNYDLIWWHDKLMPATQCGYDADANDKFDEEGVVWDTTFEYQRLCEPVGHNGGDNPLP